MERLSDYDYDLPEELIAQTPLPDRSASRLLHLSTGSVTHRTFRDVVGLLHEGDLLVMNDTRVSAVRLLGEKSTGAAVEALLLDSPAPYLYRALMKPGRRLQPGSQLSFGDGLDAVVVRDLGEGQKEIRFEPQSDFSERLEARGTVPLPPYIHEKLEDKERYQTVYATYQGSAAAPTAGLHFTHEILAALSAKGVQMAKVTLHVSLDTFRPVQVEDPRDHRMHGERCVMSPETASAVSNSQGRIIAVGTTSVRTLESFAVGKRQVEPGEKNSNLFIYPGFDWKVVEGMFTNFHMPKTTMMMMISALAGRDAVMSAYAEAVQERYRFLSFGDSMLIL